MDFLHDFALSCLMLFVGFMVFDWSRIWWHYRRFGVIIVPRNLYSGHAPTRWDASYLGYKVWTWVVYLAAALISLWHVVLGLLWLVELIRSLVLS